jgi:hypothetical protein
MSVVVSQLPAILLAAYTVVVTLLGRDHLLELLFPRKRVSVVVDNVTLTPTLEQAVFELLFIDCAQDRGEPQRSDRAKTGAVRVETLNGYRFTIESTSGFVEPERLPQDVNATEIRVSAPPYSDSAASLKISLRHNDSVRLRPMDSLPLRVTVHDAPFVRDWLSYGRTLAHLPVFYQTGTRALLALAFVTLATAVTLALELKDNGGGGPVTVALSGVAGLSLVGAAIFSRRRTSLEEVLAKRSPLDA